MQGLLFDQEERQKQSRVDAVANEIKERFGHPLYGGVTAFGAKAPGRRSVDSGGQEKIGGRKAVAEAIGLPSSFERHSTGTITMAANYSSAVTFYRTC